MDRQKKFLIFGGAWVSALLLTWYLYSATVAPKAEKQARVVVAAHDMQQGTLLKPADLKLVSLPERGLPVGAMVDTKDAVNRVLLYPANTNEPVLQQKLSGTTTAEGLSSTIEQGYRAVSVQVTDPGVLSMLQPNSHVDVLFTRPGSVTEASTSMILQNVKVLSNGRIPQSGAADAKAAPAPRSPVITLVLRPEEAQKLELAKNQGKISLSLRNPLDSTQSGVSAPITNDALDPTLAERIAKARAPKTPPVDRRAFEALLKKEPPKEPEKPRAVIDVYRGDKHVQEIFR